MLEEDMEVGGRTYVQLTHEQAQLQNVTPGELNQPIDFARVTSRKCPKCRQPLPPTYEPPTDEDWSTGIFGCAEDPESCWTGLFCPCALFGQNIKSWKADASEKSACIGHAVFIEGGMALATLTPPLICIDPHIAAIVCEGLCFAWWMCGMYTSMTRESLQRKYHLKDVPCEPCMVHCCLHWCALCQEHREMREHLSNTDASPTTTVVNPPLIQEMNDNHKESPS